MLSRWLKTNLISKLIIGFTFLILFLLISIFIYIGTYTYLFPLTQYEIFGEKTSLYLIHASILITLWLGTASSFISFISFLLSSNPTLDFLITLPIKPSLIVIYSFIRSFISSLVWSLFIFLPMGLVILRLFSGGINFIGILNLSLLISVLVLISTIIGNLLASLYSYLFQPFHSPILTLFLTLVFILTTVFLIRLILPMELGFLLNATPAQFDRIFNSLLLNQTILPTYYLTKLLFFPSLLQTLFIFIVLLISAVTFSIFISRTLIPIRQKILFFGQAKILPITPSKRRLSFLMKDVFSVIRSPVEVGYALFLLGLMLSFFYFFFTVSHQTAIFGLAWFLFYTTAYCLRLTFPLMAKENKTSWFVFTKPIASSFLVNQKLFSALIICLPVYLLALIIGSLIKLPLETFWGAIVITLVICLLGNIYPNFRDGGNPEKVSTSFMGVVALFSSLFIIFLITKTSLFSYVLIFSFTAPILLYLGSLIFVRRYQF